MYSNCYCCNLPGWTSQGEGPVGMLLCGRLSASLLPSNVHQPPRRKQTPLIFPLGKSKFYDGSWTGLWFSKCKYLVHIKNIFTVHKKSLKLKWCYLHCSSSLATNSSSSSKPPPPPPAPPAPSTATRIPSYIPIKKDSSLDKLDAPSSPPKLKKNFFDGFRNTLRPRLKTGQEEGGDGSEGVPISPRQESKDDSYHRRWSESGSPTKSVRTSSSFIN